MLDLEILLFTYYASTSFIVSLTDYLLLFKQNKVQLYFSFSFLLHVVQICNLCN